MYVSSATQVSLSYTVVAIFKTLNTFELLLKVFLLKRKTFTTQNRTQSFRALISLSVPLHYHANPPQFFENEVKEQFCICFPTIRIRLLNRKFADFAALGSGCMFFTSTSLISFPRSMGGGMEQWSKTPPSHTLHI